MPPPKSIAVTSGRKWGSVAPPCGGAVLWAAISCAGIGLVALLLFAVLRGKGDGEGGEGGESGGVEIAEIEREDGVDGSPATDLIGGGEDGTDEGGGKTAEPAILHASPVAAGIGRNAPFVNSLGMRFVPIVIPGGQQGEAAGKRLLFSVWETRRRDYDEFVKEMKLPWPEIDWQIDGFSETEDHPAVNMNGHDARLFCSWLTEKERAAGVIPSDHVYRLPTDHEWSCAIGIGGEEDAGATPAEKSGKLPGVFAWGRDWPPPESAGNIYGEEARDTGVKGEPITGFRDSFLRTAPVGSFEADAKGLCDLGGNVGEFCMGEFRPEATVKKQVGNNIRINKIPGSKTWPVRGGSWSYGDKENIHLASWRSSLSPNYSSRSVGFRCVLEAGVNVDSLDRIRVVPPGGEAEPIGVATRWQEDAIAAHIEEWEAPFAARYRDDVAKPFRESLDTLNSRYADALKREEEAATKSGKIDIAVIYHEEGKEVKRGNGIPERDAPGIPERLVKIRATYRAEFAKLEATRDGRGNRVFAECLEVFRGRVEALTKAGELESALRVRKYAESLRVSDFAGDPSLARRERPFRNSLGMRFVPITIGGGPDKGKTVLFSVWETRVRDYRKVMSGAKPETSWALSDFEETDEHPIVMVNWEEATMFCMLLTAREWQFDKYRPRGVYRLPTDYEWSTAVGIGAFESPIRSPRTEMLLGKAGNILPWGKSWPPPNGAGNYSGEEVRRAPWGTRRPIRGYTDGFVRTAPVGSFAPDSRGLHDLSGNVWEWCEDELEPGKRVVRGGSWRARDTSALRSNVRGGSLHSTRSNGIGFRCVVEFGVWEKWIESLKND